MRTITLKSDARIAVNSSLDWSADDTRIILALRSRARDDEARKRFTSLTDGPIIVHASKDPFLEWDDLGRATRWRLLAEVDLATGQPRVVLPERKISSYTVARDGTFITFQEDVTAEDGLRGHRRARTTRCGSCSRPAASPSPSRRPRT
ncbi:MAG: hypothetical protein MZW92_22210 [Comamonadaceae bacterium]|nr:hypothetical protein [Comamonadaceae bacterium]